MVGSALLSALKANGATQLCLRTHAELDLRGQMETEDFFEQEKPQYVFLAAAKVGGILATQNCEADFLYDNLLITANVIHAAYRHGVKKLLFLGSSCAYPKHTSQPIEEEQLLTGELDPAHEPYAIAKIVGIKLCESYRDQHGCDFIAAMPANLYGPGDNLQQAHVLGALLQRFHEAKQTNAPAVEVWGTGKAKREFMHVDDMAAAALLLMDKHVAVPQQFPSFINVGVGEDVRISALAHLVKKVVGYTGEICFNPTKPDGAPRKLLCIRRLKSYGFLPTISLEVGVQAVYKEYVASLPT